ncbi:hypothetical protein V9T40_002890 [Parthenolecanium corni]|uniref:Uncharacterized protein n=1 Tax=Parthenolecanium corni TaxID=536013 RepID=A0AAN9TGY6_9HEMI
MKNDIVDSPLAILPIRPKRSTKHKTCRLPVSGKKEGLFHAKLALSHFLLVTASNTTWNTTSFFPETGNSGEDTVLFSKSSAGYLRCRLDFRGVTWISKRSAGFPHDKSCCLNFRLDVSIFGWMSHFSAGCLNLRLDVACFGWMSQFSAGCLNFRLDVSLFLDVSFFVQLSQFSAGCLNFWLDVSIFVQ